MPTLQPVKVLHDRDKYVIKPINVEPGAMPSLQTVKVIRNKDRIAV